ncbi:MAG: peroxide stress protein YaaA, partial [Bacteroidota bacterium]
MLIVISPAKSLDFEKKASTEKYSQPEFLDESAQLVNKLKEIDASGLSRLMGISDKLAQLNYERYQVWHPDFKPENAKAAVFAFQGDVYQGLEVDTFSEDDLAYAQIHLRILSGLYGLLRPLDLMQAYRLEMGTDLVMNGYKNLYQFWDSKITDKLNEALSTQKDPVLINLASKEYFTAIKRKKVQGKIISPVFKELRGEQYKIISFNAKK